MGPPSAPIGVRYITIPLFVYGTLRKAAKGSSLLLMNEQTAKYWQPAVTRGHLYHTGRGWPAFTQSTCENSMCFVAGELFWVTFDTLSRLDVMEGYRAETGSFDRKLLWVVGHDGRKYQAWVYVWKRSHNDLTGYITSGDWCNRCER